MYSYGANGGYRGGYVTANAPATVGIDPATLDPALIGLWLEADHGTVDGEGNPVTSGDFHTWLDKSVNNWDFVKKGDGFEPAVIDSDYTNTKAVVLDNTQIRNADFDSWRNQSEITWIYGVRKRNITYGALIDTIIINHAYAPAPVAYTEQVAGNYDIAYLKWGDGASMESHVCSLGWNGNAPADNDDRAIYYQNGQKLEIIANLSGNTLAANTGTLLNVGIWIGGDTGNFRDDECYFIMLLKTCDNDTVQGVVDFLKNKYFSPLAAQRIICLAEGDSMSMLYGTSETSTGNNTTDRITPINKFGTLLEQNGHGSVLTYTRDATVAGVNNPQALHIIRNFSAVAEQISDTPPSTTSPFKLQRATIAGYRDLNAKHTVLPILAGTNDLFQGKSAAEIIAALTEEYTYFQNLGVKVIAFTIPDCNPTLQGAPASQAYVDETRDEVNDWIRTDATSNGAYAVGDLDLYLQTLTGMQYYKAEGTYIQADQTHWTTAGTQAFAQLIYDTVLDAGLLD